MTDVSQFPGIYTEVRAGIVIGKAPALLCRPVLMG